MKTRTNLLRAKMPEYLKKKKEEEKRLHISLEGKKQKKK
jgi:hypothetical protein